MRTQLRQLIVQGFYLPLRLVLVDDAHVVVALHKARLRLGVAVALPLVGGAALHDVCRFGLRLNGQLAMCGFVYLFLEVGYAGIGFDFRLHSGGVVKLLLHVRQGILHNLQFGALVFQAFKAFYLLVYRVGGILRRSFQFLLIGYLTVDVLVSAVGGEVARALQFQPFQFGLADLTRYRR